MGRMPLWVWGAQGASLAHEGIEGAQKRVLDLLLPDSMERIVFGE